MIYTNQRCHVCNGNLVIDDDPFWEEDQDNRRLYCLQSGHDDQFDPVHKHKPRQKKGSREPQPKPDRGMSATALFHLLRQAP